jgi:error-prone DNA polymerase
MKDIQFAELHALSNFSFLRGASHPQELVRQAQALGYSALAITDECSLAGIVRAWEAAKEVGLKLIVGGEFRIADHLKVVLLAPDAEGYAQLCALMTLGRRRSVKGRYGLSVTDLCRGLDRLLTIWIPEWPEQGLPESQFVDTLETLVPLFQGRLWIAWERHLHPQDRKRLTLLRRLGQRYELPLVAAGDVRYHVRER